MEKKKRIKSNETPSPYQDLEKGRLRMTDVDLIFNALGLAWIPRHLERWG